MDEDVLVGRKPVLDDMERRLAAAISGSGALVLVEGDAGVGKTALARSLVDRARVSGMRVAWGACLEGEGAPPYLPWLHVLKELGASRSVLLDPESAGTASRFQLFDEVVDLLRAASMPSGLLVVVDDLHWADVSSIRLLQAVAGVVADSRLMLVALSRSREAYPHAELSGVLMAIGRERAARQVTLSPLTPEESAELVTRKLGHVPAQATLKAVLERSEGNPLFVLELLRLVDSSGRLDSRLPGGIREVIGRRLDQLPAPTRQVLACASVLGCEFTAGLLGALTRMAAGELFDLLDPAIAAELIRVVNGQTLRFAHVLTQEVLYAELPTSERQQLHSRAAAALVASDAPDTLAHHLRKAAPLGGTAEALKVTLEAAARARSQLAYEHAAFQYREALHLVPDSSERTQVLLELARCEFRSGAVEDAWRSCGEAADLGRAQGDAAVVADAAIVLRGITNSPVTAQIHAMCREALALLRAGTDPVREARVLAQLAVTVDPFASADEPDLSRRAMLAAEATGDPEARFLAMQARQASLAAPAHVLERLSIGERAVRLGHDAGLAEYTAWGHVWRMDAFWELGRRVQLDAELASFAAVVTPLKEPLWMWRLTMIQASLATFEGRFGQARALAQDALAIGRRGGHDGADFFHLVFSSHLAIQTGAGLEEVEAGVRRFLENGPYLARTWHAEVLLGMGRHEEAAALWNMVAPHLGSFPANSPEWIVASCGNVWLSVQFEDRVIAAAIYDDLLAYADRQVISGAHTPCYGPVSLYLGLLANLLGQWEEAEAHLRSALAAGKAMGSPPYEAEAHLATARLLMRQRPQDPDGDQHLDSAISIARRMGMAPLLSEATALREGSQRRRSGVLTAREEQVAALVAEGLSNRQIASRLHLSERTAENHVTHILTKLGFDSRARIAAWHTARKRDD